MILKTWISMVIAVLLASTMIVGLGCGRRNKGSDHLVPIRIGWQVAWATQGQLALILQKTNDLELNGLQGDFRSFTYGAPLSEAALSGQLDVAFIGDQPAINLLSRSTDWKLIGRLMDFRVAIVVPLNSSIGSVADLKGKTLGIPFGASTHRVALQMLTEAGLDPVKDVHIVNIDITEQSDIVNSASGKMWSGIDAFASWDHHIALYESKMLARILKSGTALGVIAMSKKFIDDHPDAAVGFMAAFKLAYYFYANNRDKADGWFAETTAGKFDMNILRQVASIEPNLLTTDIQTMHVILTKENLDILQTAADFAFAQKLIQNEVTVAMVVEPKPAESSDVKLLNDSSLKARLEVLQ